MAKNEEEHILNIKVSYDKAIEGIIAYRKEIESLNAREKELASELKAGKITQEEYSKEVEMGKVAQKNYRDEIRALQKEIQNNIKQQTNLEGSLKSLRAELANLTKKYDEMSRAERESASGKELEQHIKNLTEEIKGAEEATDRFQRNVGNYRNSIIEAITGNNKFASSLANIAEEGGGSLSGMFQVATTSVKSFGAALLGLLSNPVFLAIAGIAGAGVAFKWFYDYNNSVAEATRLTQQFTGKSGDDLKQYRNEVQAVADSFGLEFNETLQSANSLAKGFGISVNEALKLMQDGLVSGANANGEFLDIVKEYPAYFKEAGISAEGFVAITTQATKQGIFSDKGVDAIKEANLRIREMTTATAQALDGIGISSAKVQEELQSGQKTTFDIMQEVAARLKELPQTSAAVGSAIANIFGGPGEDAGLKYIESLATIKTRLSEVKDGAGEVAKAQEQEIAAQEELNNVMSALFDITGGGFETMKAQISTIATKTLTSMIKALGEVANWFIRVYNNSTIVRGGVQLVSAAFQTLWSTCKLVFNLIIDGFKGLGRGIELFVNTTNAAFKAVIGAASGFGTVLKGIADFDFSEIQKGVSTIKSSVVGGFKSAMSSLKSTIKTQGKEVFTDFKNYGIEVGNSFKSGFEATVNKGMLKEINLSKVGSSTGSTSALPTSTSKSTRSAGGQPLTSGEQSQVGKAEKALSKVISDNTPDDKQDEVKKQIELEQKKYELLIEAAQKGTKELYDLQVQKLENEKKLSDMDIEQSVTDETQKQEMLLANDAAYEAKRKELYDNYAKETREAQQKAIMEQFQSDISGAEQGGDELGALQIKLDQKRAMLDAANNAEYESEQAKNAAILKASNEFYATQEELSNKRKTIEIANAEAIGQATQALQGVMEAFSSKSKTLTALSKVLALANIAINTGVAISKGVEQAQSVPFPANIAAIATTVATILTNITTAIKTVQGAKMATGGLVRGRGTGTSDQVPIQASNGESMMTAAATSMFSPALSAFNQLGGGVPIVVQSPAQQQGEEFLASAVAKGMALAPRPVVTVEDIDRVRNRVEVINRLKEI